MKGLFYSRIMSFLYFMLQWLFLLNERLVMVDGSQIRYTTWQQKWATECQLLNKFIYLFTYFWLGWVVAARGLSLVAVSRGYSSLQCAGFSLWWLLLLRSMGSRRAGSVVVAHGLSCSTACGIFLDQGSTRVPCIGRQILNHCATREVPK